MFVESIQNAVAGLFSSHEPPVANICAADCIAEQGVRRKVTGSAESISRRLPKTYGDELHWRFKKYRHHNGAAPFVLEVDHGRVYGEGVVISPGNQVVEDVSREFTVDSAGHSLCRSRRISGFRSVTQRVGVVSTTGANTYFHWVFDCLPRLAALRNEEVDRVYVSAKKRFQREYLKLFGVTPARILPAGKRTHIKASTLVVPSLAGDTGNMPSSTCEMLRSLAERLVERGVRSRKIYVSRSDAGWRSVGNEAEVWRLLKSRGYEKVRLAGMSVVDQIRLFASAETVVGPHGAGLTNLAFTPAGAKVVEFFSPNYVNVCFWALANQCGHQYGCMLGEGEQPPAGVDPHKIRDNITVNVEKLAAALDAA